jgi:hypothetical protein
MRLNRVALLFVWLVCALSAFAAVSTNTAWDVRPATGSDTVNSGGFVVGATGTDFSQQASPQFTLTGVTSVGAGNIVLTTSAAASMVGNIALVLSGTNFNTGRFEITAVTVGVSITVSTRADGSAITTGAGAAGAINIGGSVATFATPYAAGSAGNSLYLSGTLVSTSTLTLTYTSGSNVNATRFFGFTSTHGDGGNATWTTATSSTNLVTLSSQSGYAFYNLTFSNTAGTRGIGFRTSGAPSRDFYWQNCVFDGFSNAIEGNFNIDWQLSPFTLFNSVVKNSVSDGINTSGSVSILYSYLHDNGGSGLQVQTGGDTGTTTTIVGSTFYNNGSNGFFQNVDQNPGTTRTVSISNSNFVNNTGAGVKLGNGGNAEYGGVITSSVFYGNTTYGIDYVSAFFLASNGVTNCGFGANTTAAIHNYTGAVGTITLTGDPFVGRTSSNFALNNTAGAGALLRGAGYAGVTTFGTGSIDVGALQSASAGGGQVAYAIVQ